MNRIVAALFTLVLAAFLQNVRAAPTWIEGREYSRIGPAQRTSVPAGQIEVMEVFSYGCIACNNFQPTIAKLKAGLPSNAQMVFLPASFLPSEDWVMLQYRIDLQALKGSDELVDLVKYLVKKESGA